MSPTLNKNWELSPGLEKTLFQNVGPTIDVFGLVGILLEQRFNNLLFFNPGVGFERDEDNVPFY